MSADRSVEQSADAMNLDDFIQPNSVASPAGVTSPPTAEIVTSTHVAQGSGITIGLKGKLQRQLPSNLPAASMPKSYIALNRLGEFDYVQKRIRKTSIDERRVSGSTNLTSRKEF